MKISKLFALLFGVMGLALAAGAIWLALNCRSASPVLLSPSTEAKKTVTALLEEACSGDYSAASQRILGNPKFGMSFLPEDPAEEMVWEAFRGSFSYELPDECFATDSGLSMNARITFLDLNSVTASLRERTQALMEERIQAAESVDQLYNENNEFLESFVMEALHDALRAAIASDSQSKTVDITVNLVWRDQKWWVLPDAALLSALSGQIA